MNVNLQTQGVTGPTVFVTKGRQRVKQYDGNIVYLKNGDEFELELFNPTSNKVLAKISLNGKFMDSGIVLRPGERVFLERYLNEAKKFLFETYEVDVSNENVRNAIKNNGVVEVEFYDEYIKPYVIYEPVVWHYHYHYDYKPYVYPSPTTITYTNGANFSSGTYSCSADSNIFTCSCNSNNASYKSSPNFEETGRVSQGEYSDQKFVYDSTSFNYCCSWRCMWTILPESKKAYTKEDINVYCSNCGAKRKKASFKYCPNCGEKF